MADTTRDLRVKVSVANQYAPQQDGKNIGARVYYIGQACIKDAHDRLANPSAANKALPVMGVFKGSQYDAAGYAALAQDAEEFTIQTGEFLHFANSVAAPIVAGTTVPGTPVFFEDNQTVGLDSTTGSWGAVFLGFDQGRLKIGVGPQYWGFNAVSAFAVTTAPLVDNSGGAAADGTVGVVTLPNLASWDGATVFPSAAQGAAIVAAFTANRDGLKEVITKINALIADLQS
jgi:hypothetical protein